MSTIQQVIRDRLAADPTITGPEPGGLNFPNVYAKWLIESGAGSTPAAFNDNGSIKPSIVVWTADRNQHPSVHVPGLNKWDSLVPIYCINYPTDHGKDLLDKCEIAIENSLTDPLWQPVITGGQLPEIIPDSRTEIDNGEQFPGNYVYVLRFRVTAVRSVPV